MNKLLEKSLMDESNTYTKVAISLLDQNGDKDVIFSDGGLWDIGQIELNRFEEFINLANEFWREAKEFLND